MGFQTHRGPLFPFEADRGIKGDPVKPGEKLGVPFEGVKRLKRVQERILNDVCGVIGALNQSQRGVKKSCLVTGYQLSKGFPSAAQTVRDEPAIVVVHDLLQIPTFRARSEFPEPVQKLRPGDDSNYTTPAPGGSKETLQGVVRAE
jgi:hypothetical protein